MAIGPQPWFAKAGSLISEAIVGLAYAIHNGLASIA